MHDFERKINVAKLMDMEELLHDVKNRELIPNLREAIACYHASSFKACIILSFNSLVDDLLIKLGQYKEISPDAKRIFNNINTLIESQSSFENQLIEQLVKEKIFSELDGELYRTFQKFRHRSAHPTGYIPTAECARFVYSEIIRTFLSKESLQTTDRIEALISDIVEDNFFTSNNISERAVLVKNEIANIHPDAIPMLIGKVYRKYKESEEKHGALYQGFLNALFSIDSPVINENILSLVIKKNISKSGNESAFTSLISSNPGALSHIDENVAKKLIVNLKNRVKTVPKNINKLALSNPYQAILNISNRTEGFLNKLVVDMMDVFIESPGKIPHFITRVNKEVDSLGRDSYVKLVSLITKAINSNDAGKAGEIIDIFINDESKGMNCLAPYRLFEICCAIIINSSESEVLKSVSDDGFEQLYYFIDKTKPFYLEGKFAKKSLYHKLDLDMKKRIEEIYG